jgi:hypothetical protein
VRVKVASHLVRLDVPAVIGFARSDEAVELATSVYPSIVADPGLEEVHRHDVLVMRVAAGKPRAVPGAIDDDRVDTFKGPARQFVIFDSCANHDPRLARAGALPLERFARGHRDPRRTQFVLYSTREGERAWEHKRERAGILSCELQRLLDASPAWPPELDAVARDVRARFKEMASAGEAGQAPVHFWVRDWGDKEELLAAQVGASAVSRAPDPKYLPTSMLEELFAAMGDLSLPAEAVAASYQACASRAWPWPRDAAHPEGHISLSWDDPYRVPPRGFGYWHHRREETGN